MFITQVTKETMVLVQQTSKKIIQSFLMFDEGLLHTANLLVKRIEAKEISQVLRSNS